MDSPVQEKVAVAANARFDELYVQLNARQREAVDAIEGPVMVLAGPGTGKTQVVAMRIANIIRRTGLNPWNILCLTFTESAVAAMRNRLIGVMGEAAYHVRITTFHSFCNDIIQEHPDRFAQSHEWQVLTEVERVMLIRELLTGLPADSALKPFGHPYAYVRDIIQNVQWLKKEGVTEEGLQSLLDYNRRFVAAIEPILTAFFALPVRERTSGRCEDVEQQLAALAREIGVHEFMWPTFAALFDRWRANTAAVEGARAESTARTRLKNDLKSTFERLRRQLPRQREALVLYGRYQAKLKELGRYDYEDMIMHVLTQLRADDELLANYQEQYQYILVDEYQDTNGAQNEVVRLLGSFYPNPNIFVVGDDKQSIFRFQGASLENLLRFYKDYEEHLTVISLQENYRSQQTVLDASSAVIAHNLATVANVVRGIDVSLRAQRDEPEPLLRYAFGSEHEEDYFVATKIQELIAAGVEPGEIAVLYRFNRDGDSLLDLLLRLGVPVQSAAGENVLHDTRVHQLLTMLEYVADEQREDALAEIIQYDCFGLEPLSVLKIIRAAGHERLPLLSVLTDERRLAAAGVAAPAPFIEVASKLAQWRQLAVNTTLLNLFDVVLKESGLLSRILADEAQLAILHRLAVVFSELRRVSRGQAHPSVRDFVERVHLLEEHGLALMAEPLQTGSNAVQLLTAHRAKGLEFTHVFLIRLVDRHWGHLRERNRLTLPLGVVRYDVVAGEDNDEDERRLFYVALTRTRQRLYLSYAEHNDEGRTQVPSLFLREIPAEYIRPVETQETDDNKLARLVAVRLSMPLPAEDADVRAWLKEVLATYVMSVTHLNNYLTCPRLFYYRNLLRVPERKSKHLAFGTAIHRALRDMVVRFQEDPKTSSSFLVARFRHYLQQEDLARDEHADSVAIGTAALRAYWRERRGSLVVPALTEYDFRSHGIVLDDLRLTGTVDKIEIVDAVKKRVNVVDYKTGNPDNAARHWRDDGDYRRQLLFYKLLCDASPRFPYTMVQGELEFIQPSARTGQLVKKSLTPTRDDTAELEATIRRVWSEIQALKFLDPARACGKCEYCVLT